METGVDRQTEEKLSLMGTTLVSLKNGEKTNLAELEWQGRKGIGNEVNKVSRGQGQIVAFIGYSEDNGRLEYLCVIFHFFINVQ